MNIDSMLVNIDKTTFTSGILYDRVLGIGELDIFNDTIMIARQGFFKQALFELHLASNKELFLPYEKYKQFLVPDTLRNEVDIGIINSSFHKVNYDPINVENGALDIRDGLFVQINNNPPFLPNQVFIASPLKSYVTGEKVVFHFKSDLLLQSTARKRLQTLEADFGKGRTFTVVENGTIIRDKVEIPYSEKGIKTIQFTAKFEDDSHLITTGMLDFAPSSTITPFGIKNDTVIATIPFTGYEITEGLRL